MSPSMDRCTIRFRIGSAILKNPEASPVITAVTVEPLPDASTVRVKEIGNDPPIDDGNFSGGRSRRSRGAAGRC